MSITVKQVYLELHLRYNKKMKDQTMIVTSNVGTVDGENFNKDQMLSHYNQARHLAYGALRSVLRPSQIAAQFPGLIVPTTITWTLSGSVATAPKPTGYIDLLTMSTSGGVPMILLPNTDEEMVRNATNDDYAQSATNISIFDAGSNFVYYGTTVTNGNAYRIEYLSLGSWVIGDVTAGTQLETFGDQGYVKLIEIAEMISSEMGQAEIMAVAKKMFGVQ